MGPLVDSHCHLDYAPDPEAVLARGRAEGIVWFVSIGSGKGTESARSAIALARANPDVRATVGVHPHDAKLATPEALDDLRTLCRERCVVAVGEVGLDYHYNHSEPAVQREVFRRFVGLAREVRLPLVIHTRSAPEDTLAILREEGARDVGGVIHCFSEDLGFARGALDLDFDVSFSGIVTFKKADALRAVARLVPPERLLIETDAPYLAPLPFRGKVNEPAYLTHTARSLAETLGVPVEVLRARTSANAIRRFGLG
ncbi:MAG: TatD family hydrolase [Deltaproteobacteria bacterium]|nr:TatD family hydrolase [Deltaproteobacteria bacterium]